MRKIAFIIGVLGLGILLGMLLRDPKEVDSLDGLLIGEIVEVRGLVEEEREFGVGKLMIINEMPIFCECKENYLGRNVTINGLVERFPDELRVKALSIFLD